MTFSEMNMNRSNEYYGWMEKLSETDEQRSESGLSSLVNMIANLFR